MLKSVYQWFLKRINNSTKNVQKEWLVFDFFFFFYIFFSSVKKNWFIVSIKAYKYILVYKFLFVLFISVQK